MEINGQLPIEDGVWASCCLLAPQGPVGNSQAMKPILACFFAAGQPPSRLHLLPMPAAKVDALHMEGKAIFRVKAMPPFFCFSFDVRGCSPAPLGKTSSTKTVSTAYHIVGVFFPSRFWRLYLQKKTYM